MDQRLKIARIGVTLAFIVNGFTAGSFVARIPDFKRILGVSDGTLGLSLLFVSIGVFLALRPAGRNSAKFGSSPVMFWSTLAIAASLPIVGWLPSLQFTWFALFIFGFTLATQDVSMNAHAVVIEQRAGRRLMSTFHAMFSVGTFLGGIFGVASKVSRASTPPQSPAAPSLIAANKPKIPKIQKITGDLSPLFLIIGC